MKIIKKTALVLVAAGPLLVAGALGQNADNRLVASQCAQCHGTDGNALGDFESLAGMEYRDLRDKLYDMWRPGETGDIMKHQAKGYTLEQLDMIALYYSSLPQPADGGNGGEGSENEGENEGDENDD
ncbi:MAG: c-type cytochrome [Parvularcula sp.]